MSRERERGVKKKIRDKKIIFSYKITNYSFIFEMSHVHATNPVPNGKVLRISSEIILLK